MPRNHANGAKCFVHLMAILQSGSTSVCVQVLWFCFPYFVSLSCSCTSFVTILFSALLLDGRFGVHFSLESPDISYSVSTCFDQINSFDVFNEYVAQC